MLNSLNNIYVRKTRIRVTAGPVMGVRPGWAVRPCRAARGEEEGSFFFPDFSPLSFFFLSFLPLRPFQQSPSLDFVDLDETPTFRLPPFTRDQGFQRSQVQGFPLNGVLPPGSSPLKSLSVLFSLFLLFFFFFFFFCKLASKISRWSFRSQNSDARPSTSVYHNLCHTFPLFSLFFYLFILYTYLGFFRGISCLTGLDMIFLKRHIS